MKIPYRLQEKFPDSYSFLRKLYRKTWLYKSEVSRNAESTKAQEGSQIAKKARNRQVISKIFRDRYVVHSGPFAGMKYLESATGSQLFPKILGSYEEPLHPWIEDAIKKNYAQVVDVGCAEGYYAVGMALKLPGGSIHAYDTDNVALSLCGELAQLNDVADRVSLHSECTYQELQRRITQDTLIICDIEGYELSLLKPDKVPALASADMIVEAHDFLYGYGSITEELIKRFGKSHKIEILVDYPRDPAGYSVLQHQDLSIQRDLIDEKRSTQMRWLRLTHLQ